MKRKVGLQLKRLSTIWPEQDFEPETEEELAAKEKKENEEALAARPRNDPDLRTPKDQTRPKSKKPIAHPGLDSDAQDTWGMSQSMLIRVINRPRTSMCILDEKTCPVPIEYVDILRRTETYLDARSERTIRDLWTTENADYELSQPWTGRVTFELRRIDSGKKWYYVEGRRTQIQKSTRAGHITPEAWKAGTSLHPQWIKE